MFSKRTLLAAAGGGGAPFASQHSFSPCERANQQTSPQNAFTVKHTWWDIPAWIHTPCHVSPHYGISLLTAKLQKSQLYLTTAGMIHSSHTPIPFLTCRQQTHPPCHPFQSVFFACCCGPGISRSERFLSAKQLLAFPKGKKFS